MTAARRHPGVVACGLAAWLVLAGECGADDGEAASTEAVVLLHGLARGASSMASLETFFSEQGYEVANLGYPSTDADLDALVAGVREWVDGCCRTASRVHFVTHSLGGLVVRALLADHPPANLGRVVMIAPPNQGSEIADALHEFGAFRWFFGPTGEALGTGGDDLPARLGPARFELGVIAGDLALNPLGWVLIPGESDGTVAVERTRLPGMADLIVVPHSHTFIMDAPEVAREALHFLREGRFSDGARRRGEGEPGAPPPAAEG